MIWAVLAAVPALAATWTFGGGGVSFPTDTAACDALAKDVDPSYQRIRLEDTSSFDTRRCYFGPAGDPNPNFGIVYMKETGSSGPGEVRDDFAQNNMSKEAARYQTKACGLPAGQGYYVPKPGHNDVQFDGFKHGQLCEAKYYTDEAPFLRGLRQLLAGQQSKTSVRAADKLEELVTQAQRQLSVSGDTPVTWRFAGRETATLVRRVFHDRGVRVAVEHLAP